MNFIAIAKVSHRLWQTRPYIGVVLWSWYATHRCWLDIGFATGGARFMLVGFTA